jgi:hypothetical protein
MKQLKHLPARRTQRGAVTIVVGPTSAVFVGFAGLALIVAVLTAVFAVWSTAPDWEITFGDAVRQARAAQVIDPGAPSRNTEIGLTDGKAAVGAMTKYAESHGYAVKEGKQPLLAIPTNGSR